MARRIAVVMNKGGVGKTTLITNIAAIFAADYQLRTLVLDFDHQCNASVTILGDTEGRKNLFDLLVGEASVPEVMVQSPHHELLWAIPGSPALPQLERDFDRAKWDAFVDNMAGALDEMVPDWVDVVLIDTPPSTGLWTQAALAASDGYVLVAEPEAFGATGVLRSRIAADEVRDQWNPELQLYGVVINPFRDGVNLHRSYVDVYRDIYRDDLLGAPIPMWNVISLSTGTYKTPLVFSTLKDAGRATEMFRDVVRDLVQRHGITMPAIVEEA